MLSKAKNYFRLLAEDKGKGPAAEFWYPILETASHFYARGVERRKAMYAKKKLKSNKLPFPVISVGNITWGGSGKTPFVEYLAWRINEAQKRALILTRGYSHDEVVQYREHLPYVLVGTGKNRYETAMAIREKHKIDLAILDDGFQHLAVERDLEILTINSLDPFGNGKLIPRGPLREPVENLKRAHLIVLTHVNLAKPEELENLKKQIGGIAPKVPVLETFLEPLFFYRGQKKQRIPIEKLENHKVTTFSGVGVPRSFQLLLAQRQIRPVRNFEYTDHYMFTKRDLEEVKYVSQAAASEDIITTEKDFYRAPEMIAKILNPLILATRLRIAAGEEILTDRLSRLLGVQV